MNNSDSIDPCHQTPGYAGQLKILLNGCTVHLQAILLLSAGSVALDLLCLVSLPLFVMVALGAKDLHAISHPLLGTYFPDITLTSFTILIVCLFLFRAMYMLLMGAAVSALTESVRKHVVSGLFESILWRPYEMAITQPISAGITSITGYTNTFAQSVVLPLMRLFIDVLTIIVVLAFVALVEPLVVIMAGGILIIVGSGYYLGIRRISDRQSHRLADLEVGLTQQATQALSAPREIRIFGVQDHIAHEVGGTLSALAVVRAWLGAIYWFPRALGELTLIALAIAYMVIKSYAGTDFASVASNLSVIAFAGLRVLPAFAQSMRHVSLVRSGRTISARLVDMLLQGKREDVTSHARGSYNKKSDRFQSIRIENLDFVYAGSSRPVFKSLSLYISSGESIGVIGPSGAGKSTLGDLLLGLLKPQHADVWVNERQCALNSPEWWQMVGFVPQSPFILNDSLIRNVAFGLPDELIEQEKVIRCLELARLSEVIQGLSQGMNTVIGDFGVRLSGGQRQRVAIARALYWERDFLVLDEATSALDAETEAEVIGSIEALRGKVTTVIIAHRLSTLTNCDRVLEVRDKGIREVGSGANLIADTGV